MDKKQILEADLQELERRLARYPGTCNAWKDPARYDGFPAETLAQFCHMKDRTNSLFTRRLEAAQAVIDLLARKVGIEPDNCGLLLYFLYEDEGSPIAAKMDEYLNKSIQITALKTRIDELEQENRILRSLLQK